MKFQKRKCLDRGKDSYFFICRRNLIALKTYAVMPMKVNTTCYRRIQRMEAITTQHLVIGSLLNFWSGSKAGKVQYCYYRYLKGNREIHNLGKIREKRL